MTILLIVVNMVVFVTFGLRPDYEAIVHEYGFIPGRFNTLSFFTSMFLHGGWFHLIFNMWYLWLFGDNLEDRMGKLGFLGFYLLGGIFASLLHSAFSNEVMKTVPCVGASGAISAVMGGYVILFPHAKVRVVILFFYNIIRFRWPAFVFLGIWFVEQLWAGGGTMLNVEASPVAYWAHIGGFVFGVGGAFIARLLV